jgi:hypothetical protein
MDTGCAAFAPARATAETIQNKLKPRLPIMTTVSGPEYSRIFTLLTYRKSLASPLRMLLSTVLDNFDLVIFP